MNSGELLLNGYLFQKNNMKRFFIGLFSLLLGLFFISSDASAQISSKCFTESMCAEAGGIFKNNTSCPGNLGLCVAQQPDVKLNLAIGGKSTVSGIADYVVTAYNYFVGVGVISSIILMMIGGLRWSASAGSGERIGAAKKMISNALSGLVLLLTSYLILFTINPDLIKLKAPQVPMIRKESFAQNTSCQIQNGFLVAPVGDTEFAQIESSSFKEQSEVQPECGKSYYMKDAGGITCTGYVCKQSGYSCNNGNCEKSILAGTVQSDDVNPPVIDNDLELNVLCENGSIQVIKSLDVEKLSTVANGYLNKKWTYSFAGLTEEDISNGVKKCGLSADGSHYLYRGFFIDAEVNDDGLFGGSDDWFGIGRDIGAAKSGLCKLSVNLCKHINGCNPAKDEFNATNSSTYGSDSILEGRKAGNNKSGEPFTTSDYNNTTLNPGGYAAGCQSPLCMYLIPREWINGKKTCDILINRDEFPDL